jgi:hypothetical protein
MVRAAVVGVILAFVPVAALAAKPSPAVGGSPRCGWRVSRDYGPGALTYRLHLELRDCRWSDGSDRAMQVSVTRTGDQGPETARSSPVPCRSRQACDASATISHPEGETAHYAGQATWKWNDGPHRVSFDATCSTTSETVTCTDDAP